MSNLRIVTWNINSVRIRIPLLKKLKALAKPDIICLQETKVEDQHFPLEDLKAALGWEHIYFVGQKSYNGMAILSRVPLTDINHTPIAGSVDKRHLSATLPDGTQLHNFYIPAGGDIPDPEQNPSFDFKLRFVEEMTKWANGEKKSKRPMIIMGDFNIAPLPEDVWSHKQLLKVVSHTPAEVERLEAFRATLGWTDTARHFVPETEKLYSWWSYRNRDWRTSNRGRRLDHIWVTPGLTAALKGTETFVDVRDWESTSDHVPVLVDIAAGA